MSPFLKSLSSFLLAALLLTLTTVGGMGGLAHCGDEGVSHHHGHCGIESHHEELAGHGHDHEIQWEALPSGSLHDCGCPHDHHHPVVNFDMIPLVRLHQAAPIWIEKFVSPAPPDFNPWHHAASQVPFRQDRVPPAYPPPHLTCGPMLI